MNPHLLVGLHAEMIPGEEEAVAAIVPEGDGEDAVQPLEPAARGVGVAVVEVEENLRVGVGAEGAPLPPQLLPYLLEIGMN